MNSRSASIVAMLVEVHGCKLRDKNNRLRYDIFIEAFCNIRDGLWVDTIFFPISERLLQKEIKRGRIDAAQTEVKETGYFEDKPYLQLSDPDLQDAFQEHYDRLFLRLYYNGDWDEVPAREEVDPLIPLNPLPEPEPPKPKQLSLF